MIRVFKHFDGVHDDDDDEGKKKLTGESWR